MRVLHVIPSISPKRGGPSSVIRSLAAAQASIGLQVEVATTDDDGPRERAGSSVDEFMSDGVRYRTFRRTTAFYGVSLPMARWLGRAVPTYDVIHVHAAFSFTPMFACRVAVFAGIPCVVRPLGTLSPWGLAQKAPLKKLSLALVERPILGRVSAVHATSQLEADETRSLCGDTPIWVIPNPVEGPATPPDSHSFRRRWNIDDEAPIVLFLGRLDRKKGIDLLLRAFSEIEADKGAVLVIAGDGPTELVTTLKMQAASLKKRVVFTGHLSGEEKWGALASTGAFVLPSRAENFAVSLAEAMLMKVPVVTSTQVGLHDIVSEQGAGRVLAGEDPCEWAAEISHVLDPEVASMMGEAGWRWTHEHLRPLTVAHGIRALYESILAGSGSVSL